MGVYLNPNKKAFEKALQSAIYVDKTGMIRDMNTLVGTRQKYVCVTRPRRFGKSMAADMLCAYYSRGVDSRALFEDTDLARMAPVQAGNHRIGWDHYLGQFDVIHLVMTEFFRKKLTALDSLERLQKAVISDIRKEYPGLDAEADLCSWLEAIYEDTDRQIVLIIDEWDTLFHIRPDDQEGQTDYLEFLCDLIRDSDYIALTYMTGILPIGRCGEHTLNMFEEFSMLAPRQLATATGFTGKEVKELCRRYGRNFVQIQDWYDGYEVRGIVPPDPGYQHMKKTGQQLEAPVFSLYCPISVAKAICRGDIRNYWNETQTHAALARYIKAGQEELREAVALLMEGGRIGIDPGKALYDMTALDNTEDVLTLLVHLGYLGFDSERQEVFIPNREVLEAFRTAISAKD